MSRETYSDQKHFYRVNECEGHLSWAGSTVAINFSLVISRTGSMVVSVASISISNDSAFILRLLSANGPMREKCTISGVGSDGADITSMYAYITEYELHPDADGTTISLVLTPTRLDITLPKSKKGVDGEAKRGVEYFVQGIEGFGLVKCEGRFGDVYVSAMTKADDHTYISGSVTEIFQCALAETPSMDEVDEEVRRVLDIISLGLGHYLNWTVRRTFVGDSSVALQCRGTAHTTLPLRPIFHKLNLSPVLRLALENYSPELSEGAGLGGSIEWFLMNPSYLEARILTRMTALELLRACPISHVDG